MTAVPSVHLRYEDTKLRTGLSHQRNLNIQYKNSITIIKLQFTKKRYKFKKLPLSKTKQKEQTLFRK